MTVLSPDKPTHVESPIQKEAPPIYAENTTEQKGRHFGEVVKGIKSSLDSLIRNNPTIDLSEEAASFNSLLTRFGFGKNDTEQGSNYEKEIRQKWEYGEFKEYLIALARGKEFTLAKDNYPDEIELSEGWHETLEKMRSETATKKKETWVGCGVNIDKRSVYLPDLPAMGKGHHVPGETIQYEKQRMGNADLTHIGDIHSHPIGGEPQFSLSDLMFVASENTQQSFIGITQGNENLFAFRTRESKDRDFPANFTQEDFIETWYYRGGWDLQDLTDGEKAVPLSKKSPNYSALMKWVASEHDLVLYKGKAGGKLQRIKLDS